MVSQREDARDIGELPPCENPDRKKACEHDLVLFCNTYFPDHFFREWTASQIEIARNIEKVINVGGFQAIAHKRRGAKTTICRGGLLWAVLYGKHMYSFFAGSEGGAATDAKTFIEMELLENNLLLEDFPEVCYPIRCTEGIKQRKVKYHGDACNISTSGDKIVLPTMRVYDKDGNLVKTKEGKPLHYPASGALIRFISVASTGVRGRQYRLSDRDMWDSILNLV